MSNFPKKTIGRQFAEARQAKGWTLAEAARRTNLKPSLLASLEADEFDKLPSAANTRGFIRLYARELGLDGWKLLRQFSGADDVPVDMLELEPEDLEAIPARIHNRPSASQGIGLTLIITIIFIALGIVAYKLYTVRTFIAQPPDPPTETTAPEPEPPPVTKPADDDIPVAKPVEMLPPKAQPLNPPPPANSEPAAPKAPESVPQPAAIVNGLRLQLIADADVDEKSRWVRVTAVRDGKKEELFGGHLPAGSVFPADTPWIADFFIIRMSEASAIGIIQNGGVIQKYELPGAQTVRLPVN
jgi:cytoskeleton protein RodZ